MNQQNLQISAKFTDGQFVKMVTQLLLSLSVFSFLFSQSSWLSFIHSLNFCLSTFPYQLLTHTIDKNCMFLLCNGLLVFLAKYSGLIRSLSSSSHQDESDSKHTIIDVSQSNELPTLPLNKEVIALDKEVGVESTVIGLEESVALDEEEEENDKETEIKRVIFEDNEHEKGSEFEDSKDSNEEETALVHVAEEEEEEKEEEEERTNWSNEFEEDEEQEEEEFGNGKLSTEELNKKFDEFIRRMKEELRIEAQRQLIMV